MQVVMIIFRFSCLDAAHMQHCVPIRHAIKCHGEISITAIRVCMCDDVNTRRHNCGILEAAVHMLAKGCTTNQTLHCKCTPVLGQQSGVAQVVRHHDGRVQAGKVQR